MKTIDIETQSASERYLKVLIYGQSGTGKTNLGVSAPNPLIALSEQQAVPHIRAAAKRMGRKMPMVIVIETLDDYRCLLAALRGDKAKPFVVKDNAGSVVLQSDVWPDSVVMDSLTDACQLVSDEIREQSPQKVGKDGLPIDSERYWNVLQDRTMKLIRAFRDLPLNVVFLCLLDERIQKDDDGKELSRWVGPQLMMRKLPNVVQAAVNVVGVTYRKVGAKDKASGERAIEYGVATHGPDWMQLKPFPPLRPYEVTDISSWCARVNGVDDGAKPPAPMDGVEDATAANTAGDVTAPIKDQAAVTAPEGGNATTATDVDVQAAASAPHTTTDAHDTVGEPPAATKTKRKPAPAAQTEGV